MELVNRTEAFLRKCGMHPDCIDMAEITAALCGEMRDGLQGKASSLMMGPTYLTPAVPRSIGETAIALDAGGTHFRASLVRLEEGGISLLRSETYPMPGSVTPITREQFLDSICDAVIPLMAESRRIGFCFSFPVENLPNGDGRLLGFSKEVEVEGCEGMEICRAITRRMEERGYPAPASFVLLNDTTAILLGGMAKGSIERYDGFIGFVLGTGTNSCYVEKRENIVKLGSTGSGNMIINMESGGFAVAATGEADRLLDNATSNPGDHILEKMMAGRYLGDLVLITLKLAEEEGLLSLSPIAWLRERQHLALSSVSNFLYKGNEDGGLAKVFLGADAAVLDVVARRLLERCAKLVVCNIAAVMEHTDSGADPNRPTCVVAEGSTFYKAFSLREYVYRYCEDYIFDHLGRRCEIVEVDNATLAGCAVAAMSNTHFNNI